LTGQPYPVWQGSGMDAPEAPHVIAYDGHWYLLLAEGGTERGHAVTVARSRHPYGPFEECPDNPILSHRSSTHPIQNTGHADFVELADGSWATVYLGARPKGFTPGFHVLGRETFLAGVDWVEGWPIIDEGRFEVPTADTDFDEQFDGTELDPRWVMPGGDPAESVRMRAGGGLTMLPATNGAESSHLLCSRVRDHRWSARATVEGSGRFVLHLDERHEYGLSCHAGRVDATVQIGDLHVVVGSTSVTSDSVTLQIEAVDPASRPVPLGNAGPDDVVLSVVGSDGPGELARLDGRYLSTEVASGFTGRMLALGTTDGPATFRRVSYQPAGSEVAGATNTPELALAGAEVAR
jgi:hypothetical protein